MHKSKKFRCEYRGVIRYFDGPDKGAARDQMRRHIVEKFPRESTPLFCEIVCEDVTQELSD